MAKRSKKRTARTRKTIVNIIIQILAGLITGTLLLLIERLLNSS